MINIDSIRLVTPANRTKTDSPLHALMSDGKTMCGRDASGWLRINENQTRERFVESVYSCAKCVKKLSE